MSKFLLVATWVAGVVIAKGVWSTMFALVIPFWAWYLVAERVIQHFGFSA